MSTTKGTVLKYEVIARDSQSAAAASDAGARGSGDRSLQAGLIQWLGSR